MLKELVLADLRRAQGLIEKIHPDPIDPQFRIATPEGDLWVGLTLTEEPSERARRWSLLGDFMAWKLSPGFILAVEIYEPDAVICVGVFLNDYHGLASLIDRRAAPAPGFGAPLVVPREKVDDATLGLVPRGRRALPAGRVRELEAWFGQDGKFPAVPLTVLHAAARLSSGGV